MTSTDTKTDTRAGDATSALISQGIDGTHSPIMMIDRDLRVVYVNKGTLGLFETHAAAFAARYPDFDPSRVVGSCIDAFHKDPSHQRRLLADPSNLPHTATMQVGDLHFELHITAIFDASGAYVGNTLEWRNITRRIGLEAERRAAMQQAAALTQAVKTASTPTMIIDRDLVITFVNDATTELMTKHEAAMQTMYPGFEAKKLVGRCIDMFHKRPEHQRTLLADPRNLPYKARIKVGELRFELDITAVVDEHGEYLGNTMQWQDVTQQVDAEEQIQSLIARAAAGELDQRLQTSEWRGFLSIVGNGVNQLLDAVVEPIQETRKVADAIAEGNLTLEANEDTRGEFKQLAVALNSSIKKLREMVGQIRIGAADISRGASEINEGNNNLSSRTQEQAAALEETAATVEELTATVKQNADNANQANQLASGARDLAERGGSVVTEAVDAMGEINSSSRKIADIITVIDEIAFQTNLLALNAAVEAARAGEQGRGFAVVATEVRNLAQRSASAAKEIKVLIKDSVEKVEHGSKLVDRSGHTLTDIMGSVKKVSDIVAEIAAASEEQASGIEQVNQAVAQMDQATQQNAALVEEAAAASASMDEQSHGLEQLVSFFEIGEREVGSAVPPMAASEPEVARPEPRRVPANTERKQRGSAWNVKKPASKSDAQEWEEF